MLISAVCLLYLYKGIGLLLCILLQFVMHSAVLLTLALPSRNTVHPTVSLPARRSVALRTDFRRAGLPYVSLEWSLVLYSTRDRLLDTSVNSDQSGVSYMIRFKLCKDLLVVDKLRAKCYLSTMPINSLAWTNSLGNWE